MTAQRGNEGKVFVQGFFWMDREERLWFNPLISCAEEGCGGRIAFPDMVIGELKGPRALLLNTEIIMERFSRPLACERCEGQWFLKGEHLKGAARDVEGRGEEVLRRLREERMEKNADQN